MELSKEKEDILVRILEWRKKAEVSEILRQRVLTYGTHGDKILLQLFDWLGEVVRED